MTRSEEWEQARRIGYALAERMAQFPGSPSFTRDRVDMVIRFHQAIERLQSDPDGLDFALALIPGYLSPEALARLVDDLEGAAP